MKKDFENKKELVNDRNLIPTNCESRHCEEGVARRGNLLSGLLRHFVVLDFDNSQKRGFARLDVLGGLRHTAHLSKSAPRNDENSGNLQSLLKINDLTSYRLNVLMTLRKTAFTLAEVLITLGVIGIVAAMTIPTVMNKYQQKVTETRLMRFYSVMNNAIALSEIDNGDKTTWYFKNEFCSTGYEEKCITYNFEKYYKPYLKILSSEYVKDLEVDSLGDEPGLFVYLPDGSLAVFNWNAQDIRFYPIASNAFKGTSKADKDWFFFGIYPNAQYGKGDERYKYFYNKGMEPYINNAWHGNEDELPCLKRTQLNGWKFPDDCNPFK